MTIEEKIANTRRAFASALDCLPDCPEKTIMQNMRDKVEEWFVMYENGQINSLDLANMMHDYVESI